MMNGTNLIFHSFYDNNRFCSRGPGRLADSCGTVTLLVALPCSYIPCSGGGQPLQKSSPITKARVGSAISPQYDPHWLVLVLDSGTSLFCNSQHEGYAKEYLLGISYRDELSFEDHLQAYMQVASRIKEP